MVTASLPSPNIWGSKTSAISFSDTDGLFPRLMWTGRAGYLSLFLRSSCLHGKAVCSLFPFFSCLCPGWKTAAQVCFSDLLERKKKKKWYLWWLLVIFAHFIIALNVVVSLSLPVCSFMALELCAECSFGAWAGHLPASFSLPLSKSFPECLTCFQKRYNKHICKYNEITHFIWLVTQRRVLLLYF